MSDAYRDASGMLRAQIEEERAAITKLDAEIGDLGRALVAKSTLQEITELRRSALRYFRTPDEARHVLEQSRALHERLEEALVEKRKCFAVEAGFPVPPDNASSSSAVVESIREVFAAEFPNRPIIACGIGGARTEIELAGVPVAIAIVPNAINRWHQGWIGVRMPRTLPSLTIFPEGLGDVVGQWLGLVKDIEVDDERFDDLFRLRGSKAVAELLLTDRVRGLLEMLHVVAGGLTISDGKAAYAWEAPADKFTEEQSVIALVVEIRKALAANS